MLQRCITACCSRNTCAKATSSTSSRPNAHKEHAQLPRLRWGGVCWPTCAPTDMTFTTSCCLSYNCRHAAQGCAIRPRTSEGTHLRVRGTATHCLSHTRDYMCAFSFNTSGRQGDIVLIKIILRQGAERGCGKDTDRKGRCASIHAVCLWAAVGLHACCCMLRTFAHLAHLLADALMRQQVPEKKRLSHRSVEECPNKGRLPG